MLDATLVEEACGLLSTAIAMLIEDVHEDAVTFAIGGQPEGAERLKAAGQDVIALAGAILILRRRSEAPGGV